MTGVHLLARKNSGIAWNLRSSASESWLVEEVFGSSLMMKGEHSQDWHSLYCPKEALLLGEKTICWQTSPRAERSSSPLGLAFERLKDSAVLAFSLMFEAFFSSAICPLDRATASFLGRMLLMIWMHWLAWLLLRECGRGKSRCLSVAEGATLLVFGSYLTVEESTDLLCCCLLELKTMSVELGEVVFLSVEAMPLGLEWQFSRGLSTRSEARLFLEKMNLRLLKGLRFFSSQMVRCVRIPSQSLASRCWWTRQRRFTGTLTLQLFAKASTVVLAFPKSASFASSSPSFPSIPSLTGSLFSLTSATISATASFASMILHPSRSFLSSNGLVQTRQLPFESSPIVYSPTLTSPNRSKIAPQPYTAPRIRKRASGSSSLFMPASGHSTSSMQMSSASPRAAEGGCSSMQRQRTMGAVCSWRHWQSWITLSRLSTTLRYLRRPWPSIAASSQGQRGCGRVKRRLSELTAGVGLRTEYLRAGRVRFEGCIAILTIVNSGTNDEQNLYCRTPPASTAEEWLEEE